MYKKDAAIEELWNHREMIVYTMYIFLTLISSNRVDASSTINILEKYNFKIFKISYKMLIWNQCRNPNFEI